MFLTLKKRLPVFVEEYNFVSLPVVDDQRHLVGVIAVDDVIDFFREEAQDDVLQMAGVEAEAITDFSYWRALGSRLILVWAFISQWIILF